MGEKGNIAGAAGHNVVTDTLSSGVEAVSGITTGAVTGVVTGIAKDKVDDKLQRSDDAAD